jgi:hypothetical protein
MPCARFGWSLHADDQSARPERPRKGAHEDEEPRAAEQPPEAGGLRARVHADAEEAELGAAQGRTRPADERHRGHDVHPGRGPQPPGALTRAHPGRPREGPPGRSLSRRPWHARRGRRRRADAGTVEIRGQETQEGLRLAA